MGYGGPDGAPKVPTYRAHIRAITRIFAGRYLVQNTAVHIPPWHEFLVVSIGVNLLWPVIRGEKGSIRYLAAMNWVINRPWVPLLWPWCHASSKSSETVFILARARGMPQIDVPRPQAPQIPVLSGGSWCASRTAPTIILAKRLASACGKHICPCGAG